MQTEKSEEQLHKKEQNTDYKEIKYTFEDPQTKQKFKIVHASQLFERYIEKVKENPSKSTLELYKEEVIQPVYKDCFENGEFLYMAEDLLNSAPDSLAELELINEELETRNLVMNKIIQESLLKSAALLPSQKDTAVCVFPSSRANMPMLTVGAGKIIIPYTGYDKDDYIKVSVAHEYLHSVWAEKYLSNYSGTVLDNFIFEGKAVMFEKTVYPNLESIPVDLTYDKELWSKIEPDLNKKDLNRQLEILVGGKDLPRSYGYSEGYKMIKSYLDLNPGKTPEEWTGLSTQEIIEKGKYFENYK
ncbi:DUF2268 domain-containing putative Zn-dependent protease [Rummeliibacillus pycnus]|uniref:DUF2268 domain-containing putative Zn-dependent protease n=1 Tax=Rummeliibacillus pycnus TaxID=101070 RepID=UPI001FE55281|nr:DUF2268 domain-containing putative Zn-dependent protease [Rummeliibacillus pycnus]